MVQRESNRVAVIIPAYRVTDHIVSLIDRIGPEVERIYVVDDCCPDESGQFVADQVKDERVRCLRNETNLGVGGAVLNGMLIARSDGLDIGVKLDGDGQMDPYLIPNFIRPILNEEADYTKGNRFYDPRTVAAMPRARLVGNAILSFVSKFSSGYWGIFDPTNGYLAIDLRLIEFISPEKIDKRYFFESDMLFRANLINAKVVDIPMVAVYDDEQSGLKFGDEVFRFMGGHLRNFLKRIWYSYFLRDFSPATLELVFGVSLFLFGIVYGGLHMGGDSPASAGTVMVAALPALIGIVLILSFLNFDIQKSPTRAVASYLPELNLSPDKPVGCCLLSPKNRNRMKGSK